MDVQLRKTDNLSVILKTFVIWQLCSNIHDSASMLIFMVEIKKQHDLEYLNLFL